MQDPEVWNRIDPLVRERLAHLFDVPQRTPGVRTDQQNEADAFLNAPYGRYVPADVNVHDTWAPGKYGPIPVRVYWPKHTVAERGLVWIHGGAFIFGDLDMPEADQTSREVAKRASAVVVSVDYRLAINGIHHPVPQDDVLAAWNWAVQESNLLPADKPWMLGGGSAGGNLTIMATLRLRDGEGPMPARILPIYPAAHTPLPWSDALDRDMKAIPDFVRIPPEVGQRINRMYLGDNPVLQPPSHINTETDLSGTPPTLVITCEFDDLRDGGIAYAEQARAAGVDVEYYMEPGVLHGHLNILGHPATSRTLDVMADFMRRH